jgi:protein-tyrosine phosphatase
MTEKETEKFEKVQSKIEKTINPFITVKIPMPDGVDKEAFLNLEKDSEFIETVKEKAKVWLSEK